VIHSERVALELDGARMPGVLTRPAEARAAVLLIPGSLWSDVDGNYPAMNASPGLYKDLAEQLTERGAAVLRFAKTGPGTGTEVLDEERFRRCFRIFPQRLRVASAWLDELEHRCPGLPVFLAGHSEGAVVGTLLARERANARGLALLSGPALPLLRLLIWQQHETRRREGADGAAAEAEFRAALGWLDDFVAERPLPEDFGGNPYVQALRFASRPENAPYLRSLEQVDPAAELARLALPVLIVQGGRDPSVSEPNADLLARAQPRAEIARFPKLQHFYKEIPEGLSAEEAFQYRGPTDPGVAATLARWLERWL